MSNSYTPLPRASMEYIVGLLYILLLVYNISGQVFES
jgi:hypothetical protein